MHNDSIGMHVLKMSYMMVIERNFINYEREKERAREKEREGSVFRF